MAARAKIVIYKMNEEKLERGQVGITIINNYIDLRNVPQASTLISKFTIEQLNRLPTVITKITKDEKYKILIVKVTRVKKLLESDTPLKEI